MSDRGRGGFGAQNAKIADDFSRRRVMLVDCLDAAGARFEDTAARARALESATGVVEPLAPVCHEAGRLDGRARIAIESALERLRPGIVIVSAPSRSAKRSASAMRSRAASSRRWCRDDST